ncbi:hypothetical protein ACWEQL_11580 [Kitasatospora sp. NPDC004240]
MSRRPGRLFAAAALTFVLAVGGVGAGTAPAAATALPIEQCTTTSGVVLAVDFSRWGGPLLRSCGTTPTTGYALLNQGGWKTTGTGHDGPAFVCRIGYSGFQGGKQFPTPDQDKCVLTPPATAYWSYWHADPGQNDWSYSQLGAMSYRPKPGSVDLWVFGGTDIEGTEGRPTVSPDSVRARNTTPGGPAVTPDPPQPPPPAAGGAAGGATNGGGGGGTGGAGGTTGGPAGGTKRPPSGAGTGGGTTPASPAAEAGAPPAPQPADAGVPATPVEAPVAQPTDTPPAGDTATAAPTVTGSPSPANAAGPVVVDAAPAADAPHDSGSMLPAVVGAVLVVVLGVATVVTGRRRRRQAE